MTTYIAGTMMSVETTPGTTWVNNNTNINPTGYTGSSTIAKLAINNTLQIGSINNPTLYNPILTGAIENVNVSSSAIPSTANITLNSGSVWLYTGTSANTFTINLTTSGAFANLNSLMAVGQSVTATVINYQGATPQSWYSTGIQIDGTATGVSTYWQGNVAPASGQAINGYDVYNITAIKTATTPTYVVLASQTKF